MSRGKSVEFFLRTPTMIGSGVGCVYGTRKTQPEESPNLKDPTFEHREKDSVGSEDLRRPCLTIDPSYRPPDLFSDPVPEFGSDSNLMPCPPSISIGARPNMDGSTTVVSDGDESLYQSVDEENLTDRQIHRDEFDLAYRIKGTYRILDLISEQGSGGLVDKIIISQNSLKAFVNSVCPGAYASMTKVNFKALDNYVIKPVGVYGSKEEIVRFLSQLGAINKTIKAQLLVNPETNVRIQPTLRSGLYIVTTSEQTGDAHQIFVLYWPEQTTWDDSAANSVRRNRITFMRYLTKMCDQVVSLISSEHAATIIWSERDSEDEDDNLDIDQDVSDRMFTFEVAQTNKQEETVTVRRGFKASSHAIVLPEAPVADSDLMMPAPIAPFLLFGEVVQGFMTVEYRELMVTQEPYKGHYMTSMKLESQLLSDRLRLSEELDEESVRILVNSGLNKRFPQECRKWKHETNAVQSTSDSSAKRRVNDMTAKSQKELPALRRQIFEALLDEVLRLYPCFDREAFPYDDVAAEKPVNDPQPASEILALHPKAKDEMARQLRYAFQSIDDPEFRNAKDRICIFKQSRLLLKQDPRELAEQEYMPLLQEVLVEDVDQALGNVKGNKPSDGGGDKRKRTILGGLRLAVKEFFLGESSMETLWNDLFRQATYAAWNITDSQFLTQLGEDLERFAEYGDPLRPLGDKAKEKAYAHLKTRITTRTNKLTPAVHRIQENEITEQIKRELASRAQDEQRRLRTYVDHLRAPIGYRITGARASQQEPTAVYTVHAMNLTEEDKHQLRLNPSAIPSPQFRHAQLLESDKLLMVIADRSGNLFVYLDSLASIAGAVARGRGKPLNREKVGQDFLLAYDEAKKLLAVVSSEKACCTRLRCCGCVIIDVSHSQLQLHVFVFDDVRGFQALGSAIDLRQWYANDALSIRRACFVSGSEELALVDSLAQARVFSLVTLQFRPATLHLEQVPYSVSSTPDGACLLVTQAKESQLAVTAYHWSAFGSTEGIPLELGSLTIEHRSIVTSLINRSAVHIVDLDFEAHACRSHALDITRKVTEFSFKEKGVRGSARQAGSGGNTSAHNCLIDCHADVWTRFPVLPAVQREAISSSSLRSTRTLVFITDRDYQQYAPHFSDMIFTFERGTKKPTGDVLKSIKVSAASFVVFAAELCGSGERANSTQSRSWNISAYRAGEWVVEFLCLIPIHLALTRDNRFIPLKDGVYSPDLEGSLLGADVNHIVNSLSFGWYESLFQSYMAFKPVKVVSSMGEQSVGKSFALNHLADTSFAGSAMRTTEGVWMSVTPTKDTLIVVLDFEGVHSIERSAQEDTLLVLFNTAISNLVLFRNNFALGRDITGLFQSFQSSSTVLDPKANPSLFQSTLVIIIKDVVDSDKVEIAREFSLKFQRIVADEQETNFISRLHAGKLSIIPCYSPAVKRQLDRQAVTHRSAGEFLQLMKTLMAKLKANDWGAMSQTMASHRAQLISTLLANALAFGYAEIYPERELLKNLDTDMPIEMEDTPHQLFIGIGSGNDQSVARERTLTVLRTAWEGYPSRQYGTEDEWMAGLTQHLETIVDLRIAHLREWLDQNLSRFQAADGGGGSHASIDELRRHFEGSIVDLRGNVQLCGKTCAECQLRMNRRSIGHVRRALVTQGNTYVSRTNICVGNVASSLEDMVVRMYAPNCRSGFDEDKVIDHIDEEHLCAAPVHACGKLCGLSDVQLVDGSLYSCPGTCRIPSDTDHVLHQCDARFCSIQYQDHMHGLDSGEIHLCGQEHLCTAICAAPGICEIETVPHSIEATFTGRNKTFQYTKFSQAARRLKCIKPIPSGATRHKGPHNHSLDKKAIHFCEAKCKNCGYFCTLPLGHPQQEHETRHGPMARTRWIVDGPDDVPLEIEGRKFSTNDEGAPMMCNFVCSEMGRHVHIDYCRADYEAECTGNEELQHLTRRIQPDPGRPKDLLTHSLFWKRSGFKDPYSREEQANFAKCDAMCGGPEHTAAGGGAAIPSYCVLPLFHAPLNPNTAAAGESVGGSTDVFQRKEEFDNGHPR
ncbi:hypothetical protein L210DRAFT_3510849 [Boletus edulis BED1]|uniref:Guanylate-binding protein N-terminal domain-containing protein n=1 Tax=Boletus edulis BED1 TaxID=1328754 RepID=A0AAD4BCV7_BOLED|nr:hypothetical protein L210DRAFT_3510849 [Boletus edulis BED1]